MRPKSKPSSFLPEFLQQELHVDTPEVHPFINLVDRLFDIASDAIKQEIESIEFKPYATKGIEKALNTMGVETSTLSGKEIKMLHAMLPHLLQGDIRIEQVKQVASLYFPSPEVEFATKERPSYLNRRARFRLTVSPFTQKTILVKVHPSFIGTRAEDEFTQTISCFLEKHLKVHVVASSAPPLRGISPMPKLSQQTMKQWRI